MSNPTEDFARNYLKENLTNAPERWQKNFKLMYGRNDGKRSVEDTLKMSVLEVVLEMPKQQLMYATEQVQNGLDQEAKERLKK